MTGFFTRAPNLRFPYNPVLGISLATYKKCKVKSNENGKELDSLTSKSKSDYTTLAKGLIKGGMAKQIQEELATSTQGEAKLLFTWAIMEHF